MTDRFTLAHRLSPDHFTTRLHADVRDGLTAAPKTLPPKWLYDTRGSELFEDITRLTEYYPTRAEDEVLDRHAADIARLTGADTLVELGSGSSAKTRRLLDALTAHGTLRRYAPVDVSPAALLAAGEALCRDRPGLRVAATVADFEAELVLPEPSGGPRLVAFLGSTIGNLPPARRSAFFSALRAALGGGDALLLGADLVKDPAVLLRAYDDPHGVTAEFNRNVLHMLNRELHADFAPGSFAHRAVWDAEAEQIEMRLRARTAQTVKLPPLDLSVDFADGEELRTETSAKFRRAGLTAELAHRGFGVRAWWTDERERFAVLLAVPD
ncbi:L-histidine N(alpha)-methyltransferase [Streptomyces boncukensis]|uniref:L-histidine N(Alpha)-methyltransferase n=1 Tax=Streptomyces boncukensis TaxID=2711219 RepID=A0A6G4X4T4_9ACTN|nr:L-histidine N(alpha)-methyltransferase [Streptomyces boncukensis]NGO72546.1 L-histidine N(alpha)-methyltransferase [Streptomyces boncukensis]